MSSLSHSIWNRRPFNFGTALNFCGAEWENRKFPQHIFLPPSPSSFQGTPLMIGYAENQQTALNKDG
jgi:hypothetical protein